MRRLYNPRGKALILFCLCLYSFVPSFSQTKVIDSSEQGYRTVVAGPEYKRSGLHKLLWGSNYRREWTTPVRVKVFNIDTAFGGLKPTEQGGGRQTKTLRLVDAAGQQYVLRSVDKEYRGALPEIVAGTVVESIAKDQVSTSHPFAAITIPEMIEAAGVYHTNPQVVFVPYTPSLGKFNETFANTLCLFEQRADDNEVNASNFGNSADVVGTDKMFEKVFGENDHRVDQKAFLRARLFDIFLGDWGRHEDQWRWARFKEDGNTVYRPIPRDRDQTYTKFEGFLVKSILGIEELEHLSSFKARIKNIKKYNFPPRYLDRQLLNELSLDTWISTAQDLQQRLTDAVIEESIRQMPPELFKLSGPAITGKLKARRDDLVEYATKYYHVISKQVEIVGSDDAETFTLQQNDSGQLNLTVYDQNKQGEKQPNPFYTRTFKPSETKEIRLYGLKGDDRFVMQGDDRSKIKVKVIAGEGNDIINNQTSSKLRYYDYSKGTVEGRVKSRVSSRDTIYNRYDYKGFHYNVGHTIKFPSFSNVRGVHFNVGYTYTHYYWHKTPYSWNQTLKFNYSFLNKTFGGDYGATFYQLFGKWNLNVLGRYDQRLKNYYFGIGNETPNVQEKDFYELFTEEAVASVGINRPIGRNQFFGIRGFYEGYKVESKTGKYVTQQIPGGDPSVFNFKNFGGGEAEYRFIKVNDPAVPTKGIGFDAAVSHTVNLDQASRSFTRVSAGFGYYLPLFGKFSLAGRIAASKIYGDPEIYQLNWIGSGSTLRGYNRQRFRAKTVYFDQNDLRFITKFRSRLFNGKIGLIAFFDDARAWQPGEDSDKWHIGYGGGLMIAPLNRIAITAYYGISEETSRFHIRLGTFF